MQTLPAPSSSAASDGAVSRVSQVLARLPEAIRDHVPAGIPALGARHWFSALRPLVYLNHAAVSPPSALVRAAILAMLEDYSARGVDAVADAAAQRERLRGQLAELVGAAPSDIGLSPNTTHGVLAIAHGLDWRPGDRIICFDGEFPTNVVPWQQAALTYGLSVEFKALSDFDRDPADALKGLEASLVRGVRLIAVSAVQFASGRAMPLRELAALCHQYGAELFVDAIQALGVVPLDLRGMGIDYLTAGSHKWLMGTEGCGFLAVHPDRASSLIPRLAGWLSVEAPLDFLFSGRPDLRYDKPVRQRADFVEVGAPNALGLAGLEAGIAPILDLGPTRILAHVQSLHDLLEGPMVERGFRSLRAADPAGRSGILSFSAPPDLALQRFHSLLGAQGISASQPNGLLRFSPHWPNGPEQVGAVLEAVDAALTAARS